VKGVALFRSTPLLVVLAACNSAAAASKQHATAAVTVPVAQVRRADLQNDIVLTAEFRAYQDVDVMAKVAGYVKVIRVDIGDHVRQGELLATLEVPELENDLTRSAAAVRAALADVAAADDALARAQASYDIAHLSFTRIARVAQTDSGLVPMQDVDVARAHDLEAAAQLASARSALEAAKEHVAEAEADHARVTTMEAYTAIRAPFDGVITKRYANTGSMIQAGTSSASQAMPVVRLAQNDVLRLTLPLPVTAVSTIHVGDPLAIDVVTLGTTIQGRISRFADNVQTATRTMETEVDVPNPDGRLVPGMYAEAHLRVASSDNVLSVPLDAVDGLGTPTSKAYVVGPGNVLRVVPVQTGVETPVSVEIRSGVREGATVVVGRHAGLVDGQTVDPRVATYDVGADTGASRR
jgi:RND family efflux transporter MFP subunit